MRREPSSFHGALDVSPQGTPRHRGRLTTGDASPRGTHGAETGGKQRSAPPATFDPWTLGTRDRHVGAAHTSPPGRAAGGVPLRGCWSRLLRSLRPTAPLASGETEAGKEKRPRVSLCHRLCLTQPGLHRTTALPTLVTTRTPKGVRCPDPAGPAQHRGSPGYGASARGAVSLWGQGPPGPLALCPTPRYDCLPSMLVTQ